MAREPQVTRTIVTTTAKVKCADLTTNQVVEKEFTLPRTYKDNEKLLKVVKSMVETDSDKVVTIVDKSVATKLYGMSEADFLKNSIELDPETRKALEVETEDEEEDEE